MGIRPELAVRWSGKQVAELALKQNKTDSAITAVHINELVMCFSVGSDCQMSSEGDD